MFMCHLSIMTNLNLDCKLFILGGVQMRLFHVSEESDIAEFVPRIPYRNDMDKSKGLVWSLTEPSLPNWLTPRDCPRVG